jgi:hypothetical protein
MNLTVAIHDRSADVQRGEKKVATLVLDYRYQLKAVVIFPTATATEREQVLRLAGSHAARYVVNRERLAFGGLMIETSRNSRLTTYDSHALLSFEEVDEHVAETPVTDIEAGLKRLNVPVITAAYSTPTAALMAAFLDERLGGAVAVANAAVDHSGDIDLEVAVTGEDAQFRFWHQVSMPSTPGGWALNVVPAYHPVRDRRRDQVFLVNGDTDALLTGDAVRYIRSPEESWTAPPSGLFGTWSYMKHPFYAAGRSFSLKVVPMHIMAAKGVEDLVKLLLGALEREGKYVAISGGFIAPDGTAPVRHPGRQHGTERFCAWALEVLSREGAGADAFVPEWARHHALIEA